jgi:hypothetical protein
MKQEAGSAETRIQFQVQDETSPLRSAETATDGGDWDDIQADDGVVDSRRESFAVKAEKLHPGEHVIVLRAYDTAGNAGVGKAIVRIPSSPKR